MQHFETEVINLTNEKKSHQAKKVFLTKWIRDQRNYIADLEECKGRSGYYLGDKIQPWTISTAKNELTVLVEIRSRFNSKPVKISEEKKQYLSDQLNEMNLMIDYYSDAKDEPKYLKWITAKSKFLDAVACLLDLPIGEWHTISTYIKPKNEK